mmetsp:Transcript_10411/g.27282  ORF Transcript_10411/g.27282 Transcript_10411/m.27282 type:complete len:239 (-) Transcript_10411:6-722(-)
MCQNSTPYCSQFWFIFFLLSLPLQVFQLCRRILESFIQMSCLGLWELSPVYVALSLLLDFELQTIRTLSGEKLRARVKDELNYLTAYRDACTGHAIILSMKFGAGMPSEAEKQLLLSHRLRFLEFLPKSYRIDIDYVISQVQNYRRTLVVNQTSSSLLLWKKALAVSQKISAPSKDGFLVTISSTLSSQLKQLLLKIPLKLPLRNLQDLTVKLPTEEQDGPCGHSLSPLLMIENQIKT